MLFCDGESSCACTLISHMPGKGILDFGTHSLIFGAAMLGLKPFQKLIKLHLKKGSWVFGPQYPYY